MSTVPNAILSPPQLGVHSIGESQGSADVQPTGNSLNLGEVYFFEEYEDQFAEYLERLVNLHLERLDWYDSGFVSTMDFIPETADEVYHSNMYCLSWFYDGVYPFECSDKEYENELAEEVFSRMGASAC